VDPDTRSGPRRQLVARLTIGTITPCTLSTKSFHHGAHGEHGGISFESPHRERSRLLVERDLAAEEVAVWRPSHRRAVRGALM
jgi:hypothetical protein